MDSQEMVRLKKEKAALKERVSFLETKLRRVEDGYYQPQDQLKQLLRDCFGSKSERYVDPAHPQQSLILR